MNAVTVAAQAAIQVKHTLFIDDPNTFDDGFTDYLDPAPHANLTPDVFVTVPDAAGTWDAAVSTVALEAWGERTASLTLTRRDVTVTGEPADAGCFHVDTGSCLVLADSLYGLAPYAALDAVRARRASKVDNVDAVVCATGIGDGSYDVEVRAGDDGRPARIDIIFLSDVQVTALNAIDDELGR